MGLTARELRDPSSKCWIGDADDACHLQCAGCGRGARRIEDLRAQFGRDGLVGEGAHGAVRELGSDRVVHYELLKGDASSLAFLPVREYRRSRKKPAASRDAGEGPPCGRSGFPDAPHTVRPEGEPDGSRGDYFALSVKLWQLLHISSGCLEGLSALWHSTQLTAPRCDLCGLGSRFFVFSARAS